MYLSRVRLKPDIGSNSQLGQLLQKRAYGPHQLLWDLFDQEKRDFLFREEIAKEQIGAHAGAKGEPIYYILSAQTPKSDTPLFQVECKTFKPNIQAGQRLSFRLRANPVITRNGQRHDLVMDEQLTFYRRICMELHLQTEGGKAILREHLLNRQHATKLDDWLYSYLSQSVFFANATRQQSIDSRLALATQDSIAKRLQHWLTDNTSRAGIFSLCHHVVEDEWLDNEITAPLFQWNGYQNHPLPEKNKNAQFCTVELSGELEVHDPSRFYRMICQGVGPAKAFGCGLMLIRPV